jgi:peptide subunit release factor 1 (eRF1)
MPLQDIDLRQLAEMGGAERAFVSLYISGPDGLQKLKDREEKVRRLLDQQPEEREHFDESLRLLREALEEHPPEAGAGMALFSSWALDFVAGYRLEVPTPDLLWVDSSPYLRPLAELQDEYQSFLVVSADADAARVHVVAATVPTEVDRIRGEVKNHVKKGGWSQKRYQRRRSNEMTGYAKEVADVVTRVAEQEGITRIVLLGAKEAMEEITAQLPDRIREFIVGQKGVDLREGDEALFETAQDMATEQERADERSLWDRIRDEALGHGLAAFGPAAVLAAAKEGRVDTMVVTRDAKIGGVRCRDCEQLTFAKAQQCPACKSNSVFAVDLVNELVELLTLTSATSEFVDPIPGLSAEGDVAALLRY